jgi:hypothetical protein
MFDKVVCISLRRRPDRRESLLKRIPSDWPWGPIEFFDAIDGAVCKPPKWWKQGGGAWGCYRSHLAAIEGALNGGADSILMLEDDVTFVEGFSEKAQRYLSQLPGDWGQAYLGGQHLKRPEAVSEGVVRAVNVNRTHAYALSGQRNIAGCYRWLCNTQDWPPRNHVDHHYGRMHEKRIIPAYAPHEWLCGQAADSKSDVCWKEVKERWWTPAKGAAQPHMPKGAFVAVLGLHRSGSSCVAMMLHKLGVSMGEKLVGWESRNGGGGEAAGLSWLCEKAAKFPRVGFEDPASCEKSLSAWVARHRTRSESPCGCKYPHLCAMGPMLARIVGSDLMVVHCDRPFRDSVASLVRRSSKATGWLNASEDECTAVQQWLWDEKQAFLASLPSDRVLHVQYDRLRRRPGVIASELVDFLGIRPSVEQFEAAIAHVKPHGATV